LLLKGVVFFFLIYTVSQKNNDTLLMLITLRKIDQFSRFFHW